MNFTCLELGRNIQPYIISKGASLPPNNNPRINTVAYKLKHRLSNNVRNQYPRDNDMYMTCSKT